MNTQRKILIDRLLAVPLVWFLNLAARVLGSVLRRDHSVRPTKVKLIVVAKLLGMGSILHATPMLAALREEFPQARLLFVSTRANRALLERIPEVAETLYIDDRSLMAMAWSSARVVLALMRRRVDLYFDLEIYSAAASTLSLLSLARNRYGLYRHSSHFKQGIYTHLVYFNTRNPVSRIYLQLVQAAGGRGNVSRSFSTLGVSAADRTSFQSEMAKLGLAQEGPFLVVNPNASDLLIERRWPMDSFAQTLTTLARRGETMLLIGTAPEWEYCEKLRMAVPAEARPRVINVCGMLTLPGLFVLLQEAKAMITNDTGPMHLAVALGCPTVSLWGPGSPDHYGTQGPRMEQLSHPVACSPCIYETDQPPCSGHNFCMQLIQVGEVLAALDRCLRLPATQRLPGWPAQSLAQFVDGNGDMLGLLERNSLKSRFESGSR